MVGDFKGKQTDHRLQDPQEILAAFQELCHALESVQPREVI
jgi:hypothetical protein